MLKTLRRGRVTQSAGSGFTNKGVIRQQILVTLSILLIRITFYHQL